MLRVRGEQRGNAGRQGAVEPARGVTVGVETRLQMVHGDRVKKGVLHVVFASPLQFDRPALERLGHPGRFAHEVRLGLTPKPAAQQRLMNGHVL